MSETKKAATKTAKQAKKPVAAFSMNRIKAQQQETREGQRWEIAQDALQEGYPVHPEHVIAGVKKTPPKAQPSSKWENLPDHLVIDQAKERGFTPVFQRIALGDIIENPYNARSVYDVEKIASLAASIQIDGQLVPALAIQQGEQYVLIGGHYRYKALRLTNIPTIDAMVYPEGSISEQEIYLYSFKENEERSEQSVIDNAFAWRKVLDEGVYASITELSERVGVSQPNVTKTLAILGLPDDVLTLVKERPADFGLSMLYELLQYARLAPEHEALSLAHQIADKAILRKDVMALRKALSDAAKAKEQAHDAAAQRQSDALRRKNQMSRAYSLDYGTTQGSIKEWDTGKVHVELNFDDEEQKQQFLAYVREFRAK